MFTGRHLILGLLMVPVSSLWSDSQGFQNAFVLPENTDPQVTVSHEIETDHSYAGPLQSRQGRRDIGSVSELNNKVHYVASTKLREDVMLRTGVEFERYSFGLPDQAPLPNTLQSTNLILGADFTLSDQWLVRFEVAPGIYSDFQDISLSDVNAPVILGGSYFHDKDLQFFFGLSADFRRNIPVLPGAGVRWKFADQWTLFAVFPKPQLQYEVLKDLTLFVGAELKGGTYKVDEKFGTYHQQFGLVENRRLDNATVDLQEVRVGAGASWKINAALLLEASAGAVVLRTFDFHEEHYRIKSEGVAPYGQLGLKASF